MARVSQLKLQISSDVKFVNGEAIPPPEPAEPPIPQLVIAQGAQAEGTDLGDIKVENGKLVIDMNDFNPDFGVF